MTVPHSFRLAALLAVLFTLMQNALLFGAAATYRIPLIQDNSLPNGGIRYLPLSGKRWQSPLMRHPQAKPPYPMAAQSKDFFEKEYGKLCVFNEDWIKQYGFSGDGNYSLANGVMTVKTGKKGFYFGFGQHPDYSPKQPEVFVTGACGLAENVVFEMDVESVSKPTDWQVSFRKDGADKFQVTAPGTVRVDMGDTYWFHGHLSPYLLIRCTTPDANIRIKAIRFRGERSSVTFKRTVTLDEKPVIAKFSFSRYQDYTLTVNGVEVDRNLSEVAVPMAVKHLDVAPYLKAGSNEIVLNAHYRFWSADVPELLFEGVAVGESGKITRILGDKEWRVALNGEKPGEFVVPELVSDRETLNFARSYIPGNPLVDKGIDPQYMGSLVIKQVGRRFPVFKADEKAVISVKRPAGIKDSTQLRATLCKHDLDPVKLAAVPVVTQDKTENGLYEEMFSFDCPELGPYLIQWELVDNSGKVLERTETEFLKIGKLPMQEVALKDFEAELEKNLELVTSIDCAKEIEVGPEFLSHTGMWVPVSVAPTKIVEKDGMRYRETSSGAFDYFAYRLHLKNLGEMLLVEVEVPGNEERQVYSGVIEQYPETFTNNFAQDGYQDGFFSVSGSGYTEGKGAKSFRKLRYIYCPMSLSAEVVVCNGLNAKAPAAAGKINIYRFKNGVPALKLPADSKYRFGSHNERELASAAFSAENPMEQGNRMRTVPHRYMWRNWYNAIRREIEWMRFDGRNFASQNLLQYAITEWPNRGYGQICSSSMKSLLDQPNFQWLQLQMYEPNGIHALLAVEQQSSYNLFFVKKVERPSDRRMQRGEAEGIWMVDNAGTQPTVGGLNFLHPEVEKDFMEMIQDIRDYYKDCKALNGLMICGTCSWTPGFLAWKPTETFLDGGYNDNIVQAFSRDTGIKLDDNGKNPGRFMERYKLLTGKYRDAWVKWRCEAIYKFLRKAADIMKQGENPWKLYFLPNAMSVWYPGDHFSQKPRKFKDAQTEYEYYSINPALYRDDPDMEMITALLEPETLVTRVSQRTRDSVQLFNYGEGMRKVADEAGGVFFYSGLDEIDCPAGGAKRWYYTRNHRAAFVMKSLEEDPFRTLVWSLKDQVPPVVLHGWLDCNIDTGGGEAMRRMAKSLLVTPDLPFTRLDNVKGVHASIAHDAKSGEWYLRLVNASEYPVQGKIQGAASGYDLVYDAELASDNGALLLELRGADMRVIRLGKSDGKVSAAFQFGAEDAAKVRAAGQYLIDNPALIRNLPQAQRVALRQCLAAGSEDLYQLKMLLDSPLIRKILESADAIIKAQAAQNVLEQELTQNGVARINIAASENYTDGDGNLWLHDQPCSDPAVYGYENMSVVDRGTGLGIKNTKAPRVYQQEGFGALFTYNVPVPKGTYTVRIHSAQTYSPDQNPVYTVNCNGKSLQVAPMTKGFVTPWTGELKAVKPQNGKLNFKMEGHIVLNGMEIIREK